MPFQPTPHSQLSNLYPHRFSQNVSPRTSCIPRHTSNPNTAPPLPLSVGPTTLRQPSRVHFDEPSDAEAPGNGMNPPILSSLAAQPLRRRSEEGQDRQSGPPQWHIPNYNGNDNSRRLSSAPNANSNQWPTVPPHQIGVIHPQVVDEHRDSDATL